MALTYHGARIIRGVSTDTKPTTNLPVNYIFIETDTRAVHYWDGTSWLFLNTGISPSRTIAGRTVGNYAIGAGASSWGALVSLVQAGSAPGFTPIAIGDGSKGARFTPAASIGAKSGLKTATQITFRGWNPRVKLKFRMNNNADSRMYFGFNSSGNDNTGDDPYNAATGICFGKIDSAVNTNFVIMHNDTVGATVLDTVAAADNSLHQIQIRADDANARWLWSFDNGAETAITTDIPASSGLGFICEVETTAASQPTFDVFWIDYESG